MVAGFVQLMVANNFTQWLALLLLGGAVLHLFARYGHRRGFLPGGTNGTVGSSFDQLMDQLFRR